MKANSVLLGVVLLCSTCSGTGQASFSLRNWYHTEQGTVLAPISDASGILLSGPNYAAELWGAATPDSLSPAANFDLAGQPRVWTTFNVSPGLFAGGTVVIPTVSPSGWAWLQVRAWDTRLGASFEEVAVGGLGGYGESLVFYAQGGDPFDGTGLPGLPGELVGVQPFNLRPVIPEPSFGLLWLIGASVMYCFSRRLKAAPDPRRGWGRQRIRQPRSDPHVG